LKTKILEYDENYIRYRVFDDLSGKIQSISKTQVLLIKYSDGTNIVFDEKTANQSDSTFIELTSETIKQMAKKDANFNYKPNSAIMLAGCASLCLPGIGVLTALTPPQPENFNLPAEYADNSEYIYYYQQEATNIKRKKVLIATAISTSASLLFWLLVISTI